MIFVRIKSPRCFAFASAIVLFAATTVPVPAHAAGSNARISAEARLVRLHICFVGRATSESANGADIAVTFVGGSRQIRRCGHPSDQRRVCQAR